MLVGPGGVGKSSLLRGLMNKKLPEAANSTQLADIITVKPSIPQQLMAKAIDEMPWVEMTDSDEINELAGLILLVANVTRGRTESSRFKQLIQRTGAGEEEKHIDDDYHIIKDKIIDEAISLAIKQARVNSYAQAPESEIMINVWDCAGQSVYLDILSAFLTPKTIFMLLYDARKDLDDRCIFLSHCCGQVTESQQNISYMEFLFQWMASIHMTVTDKQPVSIPKYPHIITVGTHGDDSQVKACKIQITKRLSQKCEGKAFTKLLGKGHYIVNNTSAGRGDNEDPTFKELRKEVHRFTSDPSVTIATPVTWVLFRKVIQKVAVKKPILPYEKGLEIAIACSIPQESFDSVLKFYHDIAVFLHFEHIHSLKDVVIVSPQWLVKQLAKVLALEGFEEARDDPDLWKNLRENGILMEPLYKEIWKGNDLGDEAMMDLLENCSLAAPIKIKLDNQHYSGKKYFVPSALPPCSDDQLKVSKQNGVKNACTLHLLFNIRYVPPGYLTRLVTILSKNEKCRISFLDGIYRNRFRFHFAGDGKNYIDEITISQHITSVHVNFSRPNERKSYDLPFSITCREIMKTILACSSEIEWWLRSIKVTTAFTCDKCSSDDHFIEFSPNDTTTQTRLLCQENRICTFNPSQQHWLQISPREEGVDSEGVITETELQCIAEEIYRKEKCKELAETLEMTSHLKGDVTAYDLLQRWQRDMQQFGIHIKAHLIYHLRCINQQNTVERLKDGMLQLYAEKFKESATEVEDTLKEITSFSVSAISIDGLKEKKKTLESLEDRLKQVQSKLKDWPEIKNDLQEKVLQCEQTIVEKKEKRKAFREKLSSMETQFTRFQSWLESAESECRSLTAIINQKQFLKAKAVIKDVKRHKRNFNKLKLAIQSVLDIVDEYHKPTLSGRLDEVTERFNTLTFNVNDAVQRWLEDKEMQLDRMVRIIVLPEHIQKAKEFQKDISSFKLDMDLYKTQYETLKQKVAEHVSTLEHKRRWSLYGAATIIGFVAIILGMLLIKPNTQSWNSLRTERESWEEHFPRMYDRPTLNELVFLEGKDNEPVRIIDRIGNHNYDLGVYLLNDNHGSVMETIVANARGMVKAINREILRRWINGQGIKDINWKMLVQALRDRAQLNALANDVVAALKANSQEKQDT